MKELLNKKNVVGFDDTDKETYVFVSEKYDDSTAINKINDPYDEFTEEDLVPKKLKRGLFRRTKKSKVIDLGHIEPQADRQIYKPILGGCEIGPVGTNTVGTAGGLVYQRKFNGLQLYGKWDSFIPVLNKFNLAYDETPYVLTNAHVVLDNVYEPRHLKNINQPGGIINGRREIGSVVDYDIIHPNKNNEIDAAIVSLDEIMLPEQVVGWELNGFNFNISKGMMLRKYGRTTKQTSGRVLYPRATVRINYEEGPMTFENIIITEVMSQKGDSGSMVLDLDNNIVGLLFAGGEKYTMIIPIKPIVERFKLSGIYM